MSLERSIIRTRFFAVLLSMTVMVCLAACQPPETPAENSDPVSGMAPIGDVELFYQIRGEGTPLILLHGGLGHSGNWSKQLPVLSQHYKVITVDSRGHGRSTMTEQQISYALMASDIVALMDYLGLEKAHIVGWSDGGNIGLYLAIYHPERLFKVVATGANYSPTGLRPDVGENPKVLSYVGDAIEEYQALSPDPANWGAFYGNIGQMWSSEPDFSIEQLGSIAVPVLLLDGDSDEAIYTEHTMEMASFIPTAKLILVPGTGHFGMAEKPAEFNAAILDFLGF